MKCLHKQDVATTKKNLKAKERKCQRQQNVQRICVSNRNFIKKLHFSSVFKKQNIVNTLKSYAMSNLRVKYKILQKVKILRQKQKAKGINVNRKSNTLIQCLHVFNEKTSSGPIYVCTVCLQTWFRTSVHNVANLTFKSQLEKNTYLKCSQGYISADSKEWLCNACR